MQGGLKAMITEKFHDLVHDQGGCRISEGLAVILDHGVRGATVGEQACVEARIIAPLIEALCVVPAAPYSRVHACMCTHEDARACDYSRARAPSMCARMRT